MQDWEYEIADPSRIDEFLDAYISSQLTDDERFTLMETIIHSAESHPLPLEDQHRWSEILQLLRASVELHACTIHYWSTFETRDPADCFRVTPSMRALVAEFPQNFTCPTRTLLFPRDILKPALVDEHFRPEANAARTLGLNVELVDHDAIVAGDLVSGLKGVEGSGHGFFYRGWMLNPSDYTAMFRTLDERGIFLRTSPRHFTTAHHLPEWYSDMENVTPKSVWTTGAEWDEFESALVALGAGAAVLKDYSKSEKHYWNEAMFIPDTQDVVSARTVAERFVELRGSAFDTGFVLRRFEDLSNVEARTWWVDGVCVGVSAHPDTPDKEPPELDLGQFSEFVSGLGLPFITVDVALATESLKPRVVEVGDGQVSDRPTSLSATDFITMLTTNTENAQ